MFCGRKSVLLTIVVDMSKYTALRLTYRLYAEGIDSAVLFDETVST